MSYLKNIRLVKSNLYTMGAIGFVISIVSLISLYLIDPSFTLGDEINPSLVDDTIITIFVMAISVTYLVGGYHYTRFKRWTWHMLYSASSIGMIVAIGYTLLYFIGSVGADIAVLATIMCALGSFIVFFEIHTLDTKAMFRIWKGSFWDRYRDRE